MGDESIWKKEISFRRKPKEPKEPTADAPETTDGGKPASVWKKEISLKRKRKETAPEPAAAETTHDDKPASVWKKEISLKRKRKETAPEAAEKEESVETHAVERVVAFTREARREPEPVAVEPVADEPVVEEPVAQEPQPDVPGSDPEPVAAESVVEEPVAEQQMQGSDPDPGADEETVWKKEVSFSRAPEPQPDVQGSDPEPGPDETVWKKEVSFSRAPEPAVEIQGSDPEPVAEEPVAEDPVAEEQVQGSDPDSGASEETVWKKEVSFSRNVHEEQPAPVPEEPVTVTETWSAAPQLPPAPEAPPVSEVPSAPEPAAGIHPPVPAAELPPLEGEKPKSVPFWKKEISLGGGKKREKAPKPPKERKQKTPKAERAPKTKEPKAPKAPKVPRVKAERGGKGGKRIVGLKIGASQLAAARVSNNGTAELQQVARESLAPGIVVGGELRDPDALAEALKAFFTKNGLPKKGVRLGIANNRIGVRTFEIGGIEDPKQLGNAIRFRAQEALPIPIDEAVLDYHVLGEGVDEEGKPTKRILLVVAYRELIDRYVDACKKAGLVLLGIDLEAFALLRALQAPQDGVGSDPTAALVAVAIGHERSTFAVSDGRVCEFTRVLEWGGSALNVAIARVLDAAPSEVEGAKRALALTDEMVPDGLTSDQAHKARDAMRRAIQTFARELVSSLQYYQNQPGSLGIGEIVLTGGTAHLPGLSGELEKLIGVRVRVGDPLARMKVSKKVGDPEQLGSLAVAIGLGIED
jgi:type IV pilus assembly protein PilM